MPAGDGTGPAGMGPMTGRAAGYCAGYGMPGYMNPIGGRGWGFGRGYGRGFGRGRGWGRGRGFGRGRGWWGWGAPAYGVPYEVPYAPYAAPTTQQELEALREQSEYFEGALKDIRERIAELEAKEAAK